MGISVFFIAVSAMSNVYDDPSNRRGAAMGGTPADGGKTYYYDINVTINGAEPVYLTAVPAGTTDTGYIFQYFPRSGNSYAFHATACDSHGYEGLKSVVSETLISNFTTLGCSASIVPIADPGLDQLVEVGAEVSLYAGDSYDFLYNDNASILYYWECYAWPRDGKILLSNQHSVNPVFTPLKEGTYYFRLYLSGTETGAPFNRSAVRYVTVNAVKDITNYVAANPGPPKSIPLGGAVILDGSLSSTSSPTAYYKWEALNKKVDIQNRNQPVAYFIPPEAGTYTFQLTVTTEHDFSSKITFVSVYDEDKVGSLYYQEIDPGCIDCSIADQDHDGDVDWRDLGGLIFSLNAQRGYYKYKKKYDFDRNLRIDKNDLMIALTCYGHIVSQDQ